jgi:cell division protease FtsH
VGEVGTIHDVLVALRQFLVLWWPLFAFFFMAAVVYLFWRLLAAIPNVKPEPLRPDAPTSTHWDEVAGVDEAKAELAEVVDFLRDPARFQRLGARIPRGVLLHGPPGTGKTLLAKAVAHEASATFYAQSASSFVEMFAGLGAARIRALFKAARASAPSIVFIDELDAVGKTRSGLGLNREQDQTLNQLLVELDGFTGRERIIVIGASNRVQDLDPALLRPGRFDRRILVGEPDLSGREAILRVHTRGKPLAAGIDLSLIARQTAGLTGADLANLANEAAIFTGRRHSPEIEQVDFQEAMERVVAGLERRRVISEKEKRVLAYHEAGHALMSHLVGDPQPVQKVTIVARGEALGYTLQLPSEDRYVFTKEELVDWMKVGLAGRAAEEVAFGRVSSGAANDLERVTQLARAMVVDYGMSVSTGSRTLRAEDSALSEETRRLRDREQVELSDGAHAETLRALARHRASLERIAEALLERETLAREELLALLEGVEPESQAAQTVGTLVQPNGAGARPGAATR